MHLRSQIRDAIADKLEIDVTSVDGRVFADRVGKLESDELPCIVLMVTASNISNEDRMGDVVRRDFQVSVGVVSRDDPDDLAAMQDEIAVEVERSLRRISPRPGEAVGIPGLIDFRFVSDALSFQPSGDQGGQAALTLRYVATVRHVDGDPTTSV